MSGWVGRRVGGIGRMGAAEGLHRRPPPPPRRSSGTNVPFSGALGLSHASPLFASGAPPPGCPFASWNHLRREGVRSSAGAGVIHPPFLGSFA